jgi:3D (Asp-Asp-Asp) domain-containing protein
MPSDQMVSLMVDSMQNQMRDYGDLPEVKNAVPQKTFKIALTAYNSEPGQTDATPCIAARGFDLCEHGQEDVVAANFLPMGAKIRIPDLYGDRVFTVVDRMNPRYYYRMDIWMLKKEEAKKFGIKYATVEVF